MLYRPCFLKNLWIISMQSFSIVAMAINILNIKYIFCLLIVLHEGYNIIFFMFPLKIWVKAWWKRILIRIKIALSIFWGTKYIISWYDFGNLECSPNWLLLLLFVYAGLIGLWEPLVTMTCRKFSAWKLFSSHLCSRGKGTSILL